MGHQDDINYKPNKIQIEAHAAKIPAIIKLTIKICPVCMEKTLKNDKKYCSRQCFYKRNKRYIKWIDKSKI